LLEHAHQLVHGTSNGRPNSSALPNWSKCWGARRSNSKSQKKPRAS
jgi:hypothetical protein